MTSLHREKKLAMRRGIDPKKVDKCKSNADLSKLILKKIKDNNDNQKENNES